jgi:Lon protease-like protein
VHELDVVPLFPLPGHVLLPGMAVPFHIFEPRYRALIRDLLAKPAAQRWLAVPRIQPGCEAAAAGEPPLVPIVAAARLASANELGDGRFHIALIAEGRWRLRELESARPYRTAQLVRLAEPVPGVDLSERVAGAVRRVLGSRPTITDEVLALLDTRRHESGTVLDRLAALSLVDPDLRQRYLEADSAHCRLRVLEGAQCCAGKTGMPALN